jgi:CBS domain-containing protein
MLVSQILMEKGRDVVVIGPKATLFEAANILTRNRIGALLVQGLAGELAGIVSERDIVRAVALDGPGALARTVGECMTADVAVCEEIDTIAEIMETMTRCRFRHMPVVENGRVVGIISIGDVVKSRLAETVREAQALKEYIAAG